ncbi:MAG: rRNA pseudouridine synthase, partial [Clostridia bacterium]|nr:rRNA pseudouridine synthase [Clostridia bacterium]
MKERLQKVIAASHGVSRRKAEELIEAGRVRVNGRVAELGSSADPEHDRIEVDGKRLENRPKKTYVALYKPRGYVTTLSDEKGRKNVSELLTDIRARLFPVGRLDMDSEGLLLLTNDGEWANRIAHPSFGTEKSYLVSVTGDAKAAIRKISAGMDLYEEDGSFAFHAAPARAVVRDQYEDGARLLITLTEGHNREVRRLCEACGLKVRRLVRVSIGGISVAGLRTGGWRFLTDEEVRLLGTKKKRN